MTAPTGRAKTERLLNLVIALLHTRRPLTRAELREMVEDYRGSDESTFERMFERDKDELRSVGIPIETVTIDEFFDDEQGYRIDRARYALPQIEFDAEELAVLGLAARLWEQASLGSAAQRAIRKLEAEQGDEAYADAPFDPARAQHFEPVVRTPEPAFEPLRRAALSRHEVTFDYRRTGSPPARRHVQPWALISWHDHWYLTGHDLDRGEPRVFRLSRVVGDVKLSKKPGDYVVPDVDFWAMVRNVNPSGDETARFLMRDDTAHELRARATPVPAADGSADGSGEVPQGWSRWELTGVVAENFAEELAGYGADVIVEEPPQLREAVIALLRAVEAAHTDPETEGTPR